MSGVIYNQVIKLERRDCRQALERGYIMREGAGTVSEKVGMRIKKIRKSKSLTIEEFSRMINKSKATVSKYESGSISMDLETLHDIAEALDVDIKTFFAHRTGNSNRDFLPKDFYFNKPEIYMYYYDGRTRKVIRSLICIEPPEVQAARINSETNAAVCADTVLKLAEHSPSEASVKFPVTMYHGLDSFDDPDKCQHFFVGIMRPYDTITHIALTNQVNPTEKMYVCILNPLHANSQAVGMLSGIGSNPFFAPIGIKTLVATEPLEENEAFMNVLALSREEHKTFRYYNMMVINRPNSLFLSTKK